MRGKKTNRLLSILLVAVMLLTVLPTTAYAETDNATDSTFYRIFHLDCGRKYFSVDQIKALIDTLAENNYTHIELAIGNDGLRFLLDDMSVTANDTTYTSDAVKAGIQAGNKAYYNAGTYNELTQTEMDTIISYAKGKGIGIIPLLNTPGHMDAILDCMESVGISNPAYSNSARTVNVTNTTAVNFTLALVNKYIQYFAGKGCTHFNMGCDEYANDVSNSGFAGLISSGNYGDFITYVNNMAAQVKAAGMTPMAFNDGIYYNSNTSSGTFDTDIVIAYWTSGWDGYSPASASFLAEKGHKIISTNDAWYYVLGRQAGNSSGYTIATAQNGVQNTACTDIPGDNDPTAAGCMICLWCDTPRASYSSTEVSNVTGLLTTFATNNPTHFAADSGETDPEPAPDPEPGESVEVTENKTITVTVGQNATATISGANYAGTYTTEDPSVATVEVTGTDATEATTTYTKASVTCNELIDYDTDDWTAASGYYYKADDGNYYPVYAKRSGSWSWMAVRYTYNYTWGYSTTDSTSDVIRIKTYSTTYTGNKPNITVYTKSGTAGTPASTTVTFTGVAVGTTYVTVGNTRYTINVVAEDLNTVTPLTVEYWITNLPVTADGVTSKAISAQSAYGEAGVDISTLVPDTGTYDWGSVVYWKGTVLDSSNKQTTAGGVENDKTGSGKDFNLIRYYNGSWQYFYEADGTWNTISSTDQVVIYWLQPTKVTKEITTLVKDWGFAPDAQGDNENKVALTVAVVYPDGTVSPAEGDMYSTSTTLFNYWSGRDIGLVAPVNNSDYEIAKITVTDGTRVQSGTGQWGVNDTITWDKVTNEAGEQWYNETTYWDETVGGTPMVNGATSNITWSNYNTAKLVLIYLKPVHYDTNLVVNWVDDSASGALISTMEVAVSSDGTPITFYNGLKQTSALPTEGVGGTFTLDDNAYVTNSSNVNQTFNKNISTVPGVADKYKSGLYTYVSAELSADGKTLTLHYIIDNTKLDKTYVLDFGLPVAIPMSDLVENADHVTSADVNSTKAVYDKNTKKITYTPSAVMNDTDSVKVTVHFNDGTTQSIRIGFIPASNVLYEDNFLTENIEKGGIQSWKEEGTSESKTQSDDQTILYGYDGAYEASTGNSLGSCWTVSVPDSSNYSKYLTTSFYGNGFDLIGTAGPDTGMVYLLIQGPQNKLIVIDTSYVDNNTTLHQVPLAHEMLTEGTYTVNIRAAYRAATETNAASAASYSARSTMSASSDAVNDVYAMVDELFMDGFEIDDVEFVYFDENSPLAELDNATAAVAAYSLDTEVNAYSDDTDTTITTEPRPAGTTVTIDGFRVYRSSNNTAYLDAEQGVTYVNVLKAALDGNGTFRAYVENTDGGDWTQSTYEANGGPQNEVYLGGNDAIAFKVGTTTTTVQISARAVGTDQVKLIVNGSEIKAIDSNTEMYYSVTSDESGIITIKNTGNGLLALGNLKLPAGASTMTLTADDEPIVFSLLRMAPTSAEPEPDPVFTPAKLDVKVKSLGVIRNKVVTVTVTASTDVAKLTINGKVVKPTNSLMVKYGLSKNYTYVFTETLKKSESKDYVIVAYDENGVASEPVTVHD